MGGKERKKYRSQRDIRGHVSGLQYKNWNFSFCGVSFLGQNGTDDFCYSLLCVSGLIGITIDLGSLFALRPLLSHFPRCSIMTHPSTTFFHIPFHSKISILFNPIYNHPQAYFHKLQLWKQCSIYLYQTREIADKYNNMHILCIFTGNPQYLKVYHTLIQPNWNQFKRIKLSSFSHIFDNNSY